MEDNYTTQLLEKVVIEEFVYRLCVMCISARVFRAKLTMGGHIWRPILRKVCERTLLLMVWVKKVYCMLA